MDPLEGYSIIYFGNEWFAENRTSSHHIARRLAQRYPLLYIESPGQRAPRATAADMGKIWRKLKDAAQRPRKVGDQVWLLTVPQVPFRRLPLVNQVNAFASRALLRRAMRHLKFQKVISWFAAPDAGEIAGHLKEALTVYYVTDNYSLFPGVDTAQVMRLDNLLTARADQVFVSSPTLLESKRSLNPNSVHAPHGVDVAMFARASDPATPEAQGTRGLRRPIIGFYGLIEAWIDLELIGELARARPDWTFLMLGRVAAPLGSVADLPNVHFPGPQPYEQLPEWTRAFDVAIIPYKIHFQVLNASSLKLREYLASGKPIVAKRTPETEQYSGHIRLATSAAEFLREIEAALLDNSEEARQARQALVSSLTWDARFEDVLATVRRRFVETQRETRRRGPFGYN